MSKFVDAVGSKKGKIISLSVMSAFFAAFLAFLIVFLVVVSSPLSFFTDRDAVDTVEQYIAKNCAPGENSVEVSNIASDSYYTYDLDAKYSLSSDGGQEILAVTVRLKDKKSYGSSSVTYMFWYDEISDKYEVRYDSGTAVSNKFSVDFYRAADGTLSVGEYCRATSQEVNIAELSIAVTDSVLSNYLRKNCGVSLKEVESEIIGFTDKTDSLFVASLVLMIIFLVLGVAVLITFVVVVKKKRAAEPRTSEIE